MLSTDSRGEWRDTVLDGANVREYWDGDRVVGTVLARADVGGLGYAGVVWDAFILFDRDAVWLTAPAPVVASGSPVVDSTADLEAGLRRLAG
jgi:hypothetical protein